MRSATNDTCSRSGGSGKLSLTLHAILAACLAAFAASSAAAQGTPTLRIVTETPSAAKGDKPRIAVLEVQSWSWGSVSKVDSFTVKQGVKPADPGKYGEWIADVERPAEGGSYPPANTKYSTVKLGRGASSATGENVQGSQDIVITGSRIPQPNLTSASPVVVGERGTLRIKVKMPWLACEEGRKYASLELSDGSQRVVLEDAVIASCGTAAAKVKVRGWDPEKKE